MTERMHVIFGSNSDEKKEKAYKLNAHKGLLVVNGEAKPYEGGN